MSSYPNRPVYTLAPRLGYMDGPGAHVEKKGGAAAGSETKVNGQAGVV